MCVNQNNVNLLHHCCMLLTGWAILSTLFDSMSSIQQWCKKVDICQPMACFSLLSYRHLKLWCNIFPINFFYYFCLMKKLFLISKSRRCYFLLRFLKFCFWDSFSLKLKTFLVIFSKDNCMFGFYFLIYMSKINIAW